MRRLQESLPQPSLSTQATCLFFPVFLRKVDSTCGGPEGGGRGWKENVCLFNSEPAPILRSRAGMWVGFVCFHPVLALRIHCFGPMNLSVKMLCIRRLCSIFHNMQKHILIFWYMCELQMCICLCVCCVCVRKHLLTETQGVASCSRDRTGP